MKKKLSPTRRVNADKVKAVLEKTGRTDIYTVMSRLGCDYPTAKYAIEDARSVLAEEKQAVSYATGQTGFTVELNGAENLRDWSYTARLRDLTTRVDDLAHVIGGAAKSLYATTTEKRLSRKLGHMLADAERLADQVEDIREELALLDGASV